MAFVVLVCYSVVVIWVVVVLECYWLLRFVFVGFVLMLVARRDDCLIAFGGFWLRVVVAYGVVLWCLAVLGSV